MTGSNGNAEVAKNAEHEDSAFSAPLRFLPLFLPPGESHDHQRRRESASVLLRDTDRLDEALPVMERSVAVQ
jgi:hypothetical protein